MRMIRVRGKQTRRTGKRKNRTRIKPTRTGEEKNPDNTDRNKGEEPEPRTASHPIYKEEIEGSVHG